VDIVKNKLAEILAKNRFPHTKIPEAVETVWLGIELYREYKTQKYYSHASWSKRRLMKCSGSIDPT